MFVPTDGLAGAAERTEHRATWDTSDQRGTMTFPWLIRDHSSEVVVVGGASVSSLMVGNASKCLDDQREHKPDGEGANDDENQAGGCGTRIAERAVLGAGRDFQE